MWTGTGLGSRQLVACVLSLGVLTACGSDGDPDGTGPTTSVGGSGGAAGGAGGTGAGAGTAGGGVLLSGSYPCDQGIETDPAFVFGENFEEGSVSAVTARYSSPSGEPGMALSADVPGASCGSAAMGFTADPAAADSSLYNQLAGYEELYARYYVKYQAGVNWHHTGFGFEGYDPPSPWPLGLAGLKPEGDDDLSVRLEIHMKLNSDLGSSTGGELDVWKNDVLVEHFDAAAPLGCWIKDTFCPVGADGTQCTDYPSLCVPLDVQWRSVSALNLNAVSFGNYITEGAAGTVWFDDLVVATSRIGCMRR
jgi:hypothetical protein